ncbi:hypothetical protein AB0K60_01030 [Thermopolyspora sp. NPDC052614]|uniref:hypothetical protein n=1 Tax=Thermopolyspora sp. NPDC052614 TaxID=3155682 RepID=UPI00341D4930
MATIGYQAGPSPDGPKQPSQRASKVVKLGTITALSVLVVGFCAAQNSAEEVAADCVDWTNTDASGQYLVVSDFYCDDDDDDDDDFSSSRVAYRWYYGGRRVGDRVTGGTTIRPSDAHITSRNGHVIQRGGFGGRIFGGG